MVSSVVQGTLAGFQVPGDLLCLVALLKHSREPGSEGAERAAPGWGGGGPAAHPPHHTPGPLSGEAVLPCACRSRDSGCHRDPPAAFPHPRVPRLRGLPGLPALGSFRQKPRSSLNCVSCEQRRISASGRARPVPRPLPRKQLCLPGSPQREPSKGLTGLLGPVTPVMTRRPSPRPPAAPLTCDRSPAHG